MARADIRISVAMAILVLSAGGCGRSRPTGSATTAASPSVTVASAPVSSAPSTAQPAATSARPPAESIRPAPAGHCHARGSGLYVLPDPSCTPGATNPAVTQTNIEQTICRSGWTATVRPPVSYTEPLKYEQMAAYGDTGSAGHYEEDHFIPLELGGSPADPRNLWPEPGSSPNPKDSVEDAAKRAVCAGRMSLAAAQQAMAADWIGLGEQVGVVEQPSSTSSSPSPAVPGQGGTCSASASYNAKYGDWDVYVHSDQPGQPVTVTTSGGLTASYHTNNSGYADVYLHAPPSASGQTLTVTVGTASCAAIL